MVVKHKLKEILVYIRNNDKYEIYMMDYMILHSNYNYIIVSAKINSNNQYYN